MKVSFSRVIKKHTQITLICKKPQIHSYTRGERMRVSRSYYIIQVSSCLRLLLNNEPSKLLARSRERPPVDRCCATPLDDSINTFFSLFCTTGIMHIFCRIILHLNRMKCPHLYVHMYVCVSCFGCDKMKLVHFVYNL